jgi:hypothetical protein
MRALQITAGAIFLGTGLILTIGRDRYVHWSCRQKSKFLPKCYHGTLKQFDEAGPDIFLSWGINNLLAGSVLLAGAFTDCCHSKES